MKIYTKTGDKGDTGLYGGKRVSKGSLQVEAYGTIDELNSQIGLIKTFEVLSKQSEVLLDIQEALFSIGSVLAADPEKQKLFLPDLDPSRIELLEKNIDLISKELEPLQYFVLPGGNLENAAIHVARTICRRAERRCVELAIDTPIDDIIIIYLNRLSDYIFILARYASKELGIEEIYWKPRKDKS